MPSTLVIQSPLEVAELAINIFQYLATEDLLRCCLVNRFWYQHCHRLLWRVIVFRPVPTRYSRLHQLIVGSFSQLHQVYPTRRSLSEQPPQLTLGRQLAFVQDLTINLGAFPSVKPEASVQHLLQLCRSSSNIHHLRLLEMGTMVLSLEGFDRLVSLEIQNPCLALVDSLPQCQCLVSLSITYTDHVVAKRLPIVVARLPDLLDLTHLRPKAWMADPAVEDAIGAKVLRANQRGWRHIKVSVLGPQTATAVLTAGQRRGQGMIMLESLRACTATASGRQLVAILAGSPRLEIFALPADCRHPEAEENAEEETWPFSAVDFIDLDPVSQTLRPWQCEASLREFSAPIHFGPMSTFSVEQEEEERGEKEEEKGEREGEKEEKEKTLEGQVVERLLRFRRLWGHFYRRSSIRAQWGQVMATMTRTSLGSFISCNLIGRTLATHE